VVSEPPVADTLYENSSILYLKPLELDHEHVQQVEAKLKAMNKTGSKKVLLDLRDVSSGDMPEGIRLANFFLKAGTIVTLQGQKFPKQTFTADASKVVDATGPLVVLVNRGTSGPAEVVAAAIQDNKRGDLVGEKTFGEGSLQKTFDLPDGGAVILSIAKYASPSGKQLQCYGDCQDEAVTPGTLVASSQEDVSVDESAAKTAPTAKVPEQKKPAEPDDQLNKALELLKARAA